MRRTSCYNVSVATCSWGGSVHIAGTRCKPDGVATIRVCYEYEEPVPYFDDSDTGGGGGGSSGGGGGGGTQTPTTPTPTPDPTPQPDPSEPIAEIGDVTVPLIKPSPLERFISSINNNQEQSTWWNNPQNAQQFKVLLIS